MIIGFDAKRANANFTGLGNYSRFMVDTMATYGDEHKYRMYIPKQCKNASYDSLLKHKNVSSILPRSSVSGLCGEPFLLNEGCCKTVYNFIMD